MHILKLFIPPRNPQAEHAANSSRDLPSNGMDGNRFFNHDASSMKFSPMRIILFFLLIGNLPAQTPNLQETGKCSVTLVNALPGPANLHVKFGSEDIWPPGFTPGQSTGSVFFPSGKKQVELSCEGFAKTREEILLPAGANFAMIFFPGEEIQDGPEKGKRKIGMFTPPPILPSKPTKGKEWHALLVGPLTQAKLNINKQPVNLNRGQAVDLTSVRGEMVVENGEKLLLAMNPEDSGNYWVVAYGDKTDTLQVSCLNLINHAVPK